MTEPESTESQILRGADDGGDDTDFALGGVDSGETGLDEDLELDEALEIAQDEEFPEEPEEAE